MIPLHANLYAGATYVPRTKCYIWIRATDARGEPFFKDARRRTRFVRPEVYRQWHGLSADAIHQHRIAPTCGNELCINPEHLTDATEDERAKAKYKAQRRAKQAEARAQRAKHKAENKVPSTKFDVLSTKPKRLWEGVFFSSLNNWHCQALGTNVTFPTAQSAAKAQARALEGLDYEIPPRPAGQPYATPATRNTRLAAAAHRLEQKINAKALNALAGANA